MKKYLTWKVWLLIIALVLGAVALSPNPWRTGIEVVSVDSNSDAASYGLSAGDILISINGIPIDEISDVDSALETLEYDSQMVSVKTTSGIYDYEIMNDLGFDVDENLTISDSAIEVQEDSRLLTINDHRMDNVSDFEDFYEELVPKHTIKIETDNGNIAYLSREVPKIVVSEAKKSNLRWGLEFTGGTRVLLRPISNDTITDDDIRNLMDVLSNRLNVYGLSDIKIRSASDWEGNKYVLVELAGVTEDEVKELIAGQGKFEAMIGDEVVFSGGSEDIPYVCRNDGSCSGIRSCNPSDTGYSCEFQFSITLSPEAAQRQADITRDLDVVSDANGKYLSESLDLYLDGELVDSLRIGEDLKGQPATQIAISGPGNGVTETDALTDATNNMNKLQTILITGSLPFDLEIEKMDTISPVMGQTFINNILLVAILAIIGVAAVVFIRYRKLKYVFPVMFTLICELFLILSFAGLVGWNLDMLAIAGIIAAVGTGVDDQIVILDETIHGKKRDTTMKNIMKGAFFIIFAAYATTVAAMLPLWNAGAGLIRGFALTTIVGVTIGVFLTRPAFAAIIESMDKD